MRTSADNWQPEEASLESCSNSLICPWHCRTEAQRLRLLACLSTLKFRRRFGGPCRGPLAALLQKCERLRIAVRQKECTGKLLLSLIWPWHCSHRGTETGAASLSCHLKLQTYLSGSVPDASGSPAANMRTSADSWQAEGASLASSGSASSVHGTARTEAQRLGLLTCLATSNFKCSIGVFSERLRQPCSENANVCR